MYRAKDRTQSSKCFVLTISQENAIEAVDYRISVEGPGKRLIRDERQGVKNGTTKDDRGTIL